MSLPTRIRRRVRTLRDVGPRGRRLLGEAVLQLAVARLRLALRPFDEVAARLGRALPPSETRPTAPPDEAAAGAARAIGWAVGAAAPLMPFRCLCLQQALAATAMLRRRGIRAVTRIGVAPEGSIGLAAHAWVEAAGVEVTGYPVPARLREIGCFVSGSPD